LRRSAFSRLRHEADDVLRKTFFAIHRSLRKENPALRSRGFQSRPGLEGRHHSRLLNAPSGRWFPRPAVIAGFPAEIGDPNNAASFKAHVASVAILRFEWPGTDGGGWSGAANARRGGGSVKIVDRAIEQTLRQSPPF
jgi:hypothetical protein